MAMNIIEKELRKDVRGMANKIYKLEDTENPEKLKNYILNEAEEIQILRNSNCEYVGARILFKNNKDEIYGIETFNNGTIGMRYKWGSTYRFRYDLANGISKRIDDIIKSTL